MKHLCLLATAAVVYDDSGSAAEWLTVSQGLSDETDFSALSDPGFAQALKELEIISDAENITRQEMEEIAAMTGRLDVVNSNPTSLHGIEYFESPTGADCALNELLSLDVSKNTKPYQLYCEDNPGNGSTFRVTVWDDFNRNNIPSGFTKEGWKYGGQTIAPSTRKQSNPGLGTRFPANRESGGIRSRFPSLFFAPTSGFQSAFPRKSLSLHRKTAHAMKDFAAIDFETANGQRTSVCSVGVVVVRDGEVCDTFYSLIRPRPNYYSRFTTAIHGLTYEDTAEAPDFAEVWREVAPRIEGLPLVAHNSPFDEGCLRAAFDLYGMPYPGYTFYCTCRASRRVFGRQLPNHQLHTVSAACGFDLEHHHHALADAEACARIALKIL